MAPPARLRPRCVALVVVVVAVAVGCRAPRVPVRVTFLLDGMARRGRRKTTTTCYVWQSDSCFRAHIAAGWHLLIFMVPRFPNRIYYLDSEKAAAATSRRCLARRLFRRDRIARSISKASFAWYVLSSTRSVIVALLIIGRSDRQILLGRSHDK